MQSPHGRIISIDSEHAQSVIVEVEAAAVCKRCAQGKGCGAGLMGGTSRARQVSAILADGLNVERGDSVSLSLEPGNLLRAAAIVYGLPLVGALSGALLAQVMRATDLAVVAAALLGIVAGVVLARVRLQRTSCLRDLTPVVTAKRSLAAD